MNTTLAAKVRHTRSADDLDATILRARLRRERRLVPVIRAQGAFPTPAVWRTLDLVHEATYLVDRLESRRSDIEDAAAEAQWMERTEYGYLG